MGELIIKLGDYYLLWSTFFDCPNSDCLRESEFRSHYRELYGNSEYQLLNDRLERVKEQGTSDRNSNLRETLRFNRAGLDETCITARQIYKHYCLGMDLEKGIDLKFLDDDDLIPDDPTITPDGCRLILEDG